ncbi:unnamed protein product [Soboliphyme baturini]|uniref:PLC-beta_C domain-containing protein n=1 Tax=Soboliphyme baturini TaxID=241478 RepID=A0A183IG97_9BILA|nr:unnamed protein product [Soboliphyme baturini]
MFDPPGRCHLLPCRCSLKCPLFFSGIVEALSDPRTYVSMIEKRQKQMEQMGIRQEDIDEVPQRRNLAKNGGVSDNLGSTSNKSIIASQNFSVAARSKICFELSRDEAYKQVIEQVKPVCFDEIKKDKLFVKLSKHHTKVLEDLKRRHVKERLAMQNQQAVAIEKMVKDRRSKMAHTAVSSFSSQGNESSTRQSPSEVVNESSDVSSVGPSDVFPIDRCADVKTAVAVQTKTWSELMRRQADDEHRLRVAQIDEEWNLMVKILEGVQRQQVSSFRQRLDNEFKYLRQKQTKQSMEDSKAIQMDKNIKTKAERDRRVKEVQEKNCKLFLEERKRLAVKHQKMLDHLHKVHEEQLATVEKEARKIKDAQEQLHAELLLAAKPETVV